MTVKEVRDAIFSWLDSVKVSASAVIYEDDNGPRPQDTYIAFKITSFPLTGSYETTLADINGDQDVIAHEETFINIQAYRDGALQEIKDIHRSLGKESVLENLRATGLHYRRDAAPPQDIATLLDATFEERASLDIVFGVKDVATDNVSWIEDVELVPLGDLDI